MTIKIVPVPDFIFGRPRGETKTAGGVIKPASAMGKEEPGCIVEFIHPRTSEELGVMVGDNLLYHAIDGFAQDVQHNGRTYVVVHKDNVLGTISGDDSVVEIH